MNVWQFYICTCFHDNWRHFVGCYVVCWFYSYQGLVLLLRREWRSSSLLTVLHIRYHLYKEPTQVSDSKGPALSFHHLKHWSTETYGLIHMFCSLVCTFVWILVKYKKTEKMRSQWVKQFKSLITKTHYSGVSKITGNVQLFHERQTSKTFG